jgi:hypothetical protein
MRGMYFGNSDIDLFLTGEELNLLRLLDFKKKDDGASLSHKPLECLLEDDFKLNRKVHLQMEEFEQGGNDGIKVDLKDDTYFIKMNNHAHELIEQRGEFGTRYGNGEKVTFYIDRD